MHYLIVDGMLSGTGIRNAVNGGYVKHKKLRISQELSDRINRWLLCYADVHYCGFKDEDVADRLDIEGMKTRRHLVSELPQSKISYLSHVKMCTMDESSLADNNVLNE